jgi:hypothetical protein
MTEFVQASAQEGDRHEAAAADLVAAGEAANEISDHYVLYTVVFATVLFLAAIADRFKWRAARIAVLTMGGALLVFGVVGLVQLPLA